MTLRWLSWMDALEFQIGNQGHRAISYFALFRPED